MQGPAAPRPKGPLAGGGAKNAHLSEAKRSAEQLFESRTVAEIREVEGRTRKDIEVKKQQLRQLVGDSYRDLIESADKIVSIANNCGFILQNVKAIQSGFSGLAHSFASADSLLNEKRDSLTRHEELYGIGGRIRYLVDTPEMIWGYLDTKQFLDAARRYLRATLVHGLLSSYPRAQLAKFPLLAHQWPLVEKFKQRIEDAVSESLSSDDSLSTSQAADALAAISALNSLDTSAALQQLLARRRAWVRSLLQAHLEQQNQQQEYGEQDGEGKGATGHQAAVQSVAELLSHVAQALQLTICQVGELFLANSPGSSRAPGGDMSSGTTPQPASISTSGGCLLQQSAVEDEVDASELLFGGRATSGASGLNATAAQQGPEMEAWRKANKATQDRLAALPSGAVERACSAWAKEVSEDMSRLCLQLLQACTSARELVGMEDAVKDAIAAWQPSGGSSSSGKGSSGINGGTAGAPNAKRARVTPGSSILGADLGALGSGGVLGAAGAGGVNGNTSVPGASQQHHLQSWEAVCEWVLGAPLNLWQELFHAPFMERAKQLVSAAFKGVGAAVEAQLEECLAQAASCKAEPAGHVSCVRWPLAPISQQEQGGDTRVAGAGQGAGAGHVTGAVLWSERITGSARAGKAGASAGDKGFRLRVLSIQQRFDDELRSVLQSALLLLGLDPTSSSSGTPGGLTTTPSGSLALDRYGSGTTSGLLGGTAGRMGSSGFGASGSLVVGARGRDPARAAELEPYVQQKCLELAATLAAVLAARLSGAGSPTAGVTGAQAAEQVLVIGRVASALAGDSRYLPVLLGPLEQWKSALASGGVGAPGRAGAAARATAAGRGAAAAGSRLQSVTEQFRAIAVNAYRSWGAWASGSLVSTYRSALLSEDLLTTQVEPASWQEVVVSTPGAPTTTSTSSSAYGGLNDPLAMDLGGVGGDMRFKLPATPLPATLALLNSACQELKRAGDHTTSAEALQVFEWELLGALLTMFNTLLGSAAGGALTGLSPTSTSTSLGLGSGALPGQTLEGRLSEKGVLQLLLDVRLLRDILAGGRPLGSRAGSVPAGSSSTGAAGSAVLLDPTDPAVLAALSERRRHGTQLEQQLQDRLDPIDWATYEPYLWAHVRRYYTRTATLYGFLIQLQRVHTEGTGGTGLGGGATSLLGGDSALTGGQQQGLNPLNILPMAPRFHYLPISAPTHALGAAPGNRGRLSAASLLRLQSGGASSADLAGSYSFADLGSGLKAAASSALTDGSSGSPTVAGFMGSSGISGYTASGAAAAGASALSAFQARLQLQAGSLGSMFGDKAAEVTAMAQQRFESISDFLPSALGGAATSGLLSSFTKGVGTNKK